MSRRNKPPKRIPAPDAIYNSVDIAKFINRLMRRGKKSIAEKIFYSMMETVKEKTKQVFLKEHNNSIYMRNTERQKESDLDFIRF